VTEPNGVEILLVEDNPRDAELAIRALKKHNLADKLVHVKDGQEALDWLFAEARHAGRDAEQRPKVVLLDIKLPKRNGLEVLAAIRAHPRTQHLPVVMLTSSNEDQDIFKAYANGSNSYIVKPVEFEKFSRTLGEAARYWLHLNRSPG